MASDQVKQDLPIGSSSGIGVDEWVARAVGNADASASLPVIGSLVQGWSRVPGAARFGVVLIAAGVFGLATNNAYYQRIGFDICIDAALIVGLNLIIGLTGQFDLGYAAWFGCGAYAYAVLSTREKWHLPGELWLVVGALTGAVVSFGVALPTRRLRGDFQGLVTYFFAQAFFLVVNTLNFTGGPNGLTGLDNLSFLGVTVTSVRGYYYAALVVFAIVFIVAWLLVNSRVGRAWRALRDDSFAASMVGMPVARLRLVAFVLGAGIAGAVGPLQAGLETNVFPADFNTDLVLLLYAMLIVGGLGSLWGGVLGVIFINVLLEVLQVPGYSMIIFYGLLIAWVLLAVKPFRLALVILGTAAAIEVAVTTILTQAWPSGTHPLVSSGQDTFLRHVIVELTNPVQIGGYIYGTLIVLVLATLLARPRLRLLALVPVLGLSAMTWENVFALNPPVTQEVFLGLVVVALTIVRPNGLMGPKRMKA